VTTGQPQHPFTAAWETWQTWSDAEAMRTARRRAAERGESLAVFDQHPEWTQGPGPLAALAANREVVDLLVGWRWRAMREAREQGHGWAEIGTTLGVEAEEARGFYLERVQRQQQVHQAHPDLRRLLGYAPPLARAGRTQRRRPRRPPAPAQRAGGRAVTARPSTQPAPAGVGGGWPVAGHRPDSEGG
jgi:hypothetical protein